MSQIKTIHESSAELKISVEIESSEYEKKFNDELMKLAKTVKLDGFRQGKVPVTVIRQKYEGQCHQKTISYLIDTYTQKIINEKKLDLVDTPSAKLLDAPSKNKNLSFDINFNIMPSIDLKLLKTCKLEIPDVEINDNDIDKVINNIRKQNATWNDSDNPAADGDKVVVDYEGKIDGKAFTNNKQDDFTFIINDTIKGDPATVALFKEFSSKCLNTKVHDVVEVRNQMPADFTDKELASKMVIYTVKIKKILKGQLPDLNKDFYETLGISTDDEKIFRDSVKTHMNFELSDKLVSKKYGLVNESLVNVFDFPLSENLVSKHQKELEEQYKSLKQSDDNIDDKIKDIAIKRVKLNMIYMCLAKEVKTNITDQEAIDFCNDQSPAFRQFYGEKLKKDKASTLLDVKNKIVENSIVEYVIQNSESNKVEMSFSEVMDA